MKKPQWKLIEEILNPDSMGRSAEVSTVEFFKREGIGLFKTITGNGGNALRTTGALGLRYDIHKIYLKSLSIADQKATIAEWDFHKLGTPSPVQIVAIQLKSKKSVEVLAMNKSVSRRLRRERLKMDNHRCVACGSSSGLQVDHKIPRSRQTPEALVQITIADLQTLDASCNRKKGTACEDCMNTGVRFDARALKGVTYPVVYGQLKYENEIGCVGCLWYDVEGFRKDHDRLIVRDALQTAQGSPVVASVKLASDELPTSGEGGDSSGAAA